MSDRDQISTVWQPIPGSSQELALDSRCHSTLYTGSRGPGKSDTQLMKFRMYVGMGYNIFWRGIIFDREYKNLDDLVIKSLRWFPRFNDGAKFLSAAKDYKWVWPTGEELLFRAVKDPADYWGFHGHEFPFIGWNELCKYPDRSLYDMMMSCNRTSFLPEKDSPKDTNGKIINLLPPIPLIVFSTTNPYGPGHCVPYGDVLTEYGWRDIKTVKVGDRVVSVDKYGKSKLVTVSGTVIEMYSGTMINRIGRGLCMEFTENHRLPILSGGGCHRMMPFNETAGQISIRRTCTAWSGKSLYSFTVPLVYSRRCKLAQPDTLTGIDFAAFMGWFLSEGCTIERDCAFSIAQTKEAGRIEIKRLLDRIGFIYREHNNQFTVYSIKWYRYLRQFGKCREKFVPLEIKSATSDILQAFLFAAMAGDGHWYGDGGGTYYTLSRQLADDFAEIAVKLGFAVFISERNRTDREGVTYQINISTRSSIQLMTGNHIYGVSSTNNAVNITRSYFSGLVYCITVPETETFFIRQNGCVWLSGNTWVKRDFIDVAPYGQVVETTREVFDPRTEQKVKVTKTQITVFGTYKENIYLPLEYIAELDKITDPNIRKAWLGGSWDIVAGGAVSDLWAKHVHIIPRMAIPPHWYLDRSFDWGSTHPFWVGFWAEATGEELTSPDGWKFCPQSGSLILCHEWYGSKGVGTNTGLQMSAADIADEILKIELELISEGWIAYRPWPGPADNQIRNVRERDVDTIEKKMGDKGVRWTNSDKSPGSRKQGLQLLRDRLEAALRGEGPAVYVMAHCTASISTIPTLPRSEKDLDDVDTNAEDHPYDGWRYRLLAGNNRFATSINVNFPR